MINYKEKTQLKEIRTALLDLEDVKYKSFISPLVPNVSMENIIGIRTPVLKKYAKKLYKEKTAGEFLLSLPHEYLEENNLHSFLIMEITDFDQCVVAVDMFLPYVDNWAVCDSLRPKCFKTNKEKLLPYIEKWISSSADYSVRFGIEMLMLHYLDNDFSKNYFLKVASVKSENYYVKMMIAWYFATALGTRFDDAFSFLKENPLDTWIYNKTINKARESGRLTIKQKNQLLLLKK